jgi:cell division protein FtsB
LVKVSKLSVSLPRPLKVILYAAFVGVLLASYVVPLQEILENKARITQLKEDISNIEENNTAKTRLIEELETPEGIERAARERYGMIKPGEKVYIVPEDSREKR